MATLLCVPIMVQDIAQALADAAEARGAGADLVEFRIDDVFEGEGDAEGEALALRLAADSPLPCIMTCRAASEGGSYDGDDMARVSLYERLGTASEPGEHPPRYIDIELATYLRSENLRRKVNLAVDHPEQRRDLHTSLILSTHDFHGRPADLTRRVVAMREQGAARVHKVAFRARSLRDNLELFDLISESPRPMIALGMGEFGLASRVLAPKFGGFLTFAALRPAGATAPGQPTIADLLGLYRFRSIQRSTRVYGVVGWPVSHSLSPLVHNAGFEELGHDGVYVPMPVAPEYESFKATVLEWIAHVGADFCGASVTLPHKENLVRLAHEQGWRLDGASEAIGAANTLVIERAGGVARGVSVLNTDVDGVRGPLAESAGSAGWSGRPVAVLGAGGAARGAVYACQSLGAQVTVFNRSVERATRLADDLSRIGGRIVGAALTAFDGAGFDAVINCTPVGMTSGSAPQHSPVPALLSPAEGAARVPVAFDTVYSPLRTPFLRQAAAAGWRVVDGAAMFVTQAALQFEAWTGRPAPRGLFNRLVRDTLVDSPPHETTRG